MSESRALAVATLCVLLPVGLCAAYITPRPGVAPEARDGTLAKAGPDGRTFNPRRVRLSPVTRTLTYHEPESDETLVMQTSHRVGFRLAGLQACRLAGFKWEIVASCAATTTVSHMHTSLLQGRGAQLMMGLQITCLERCCVGLLLLNPQRPRCCCREDPVHRC